MSQPSKFPTAAKYLIGFVLGTALLIATAYLIENWRGDRVWAAEQRRLKEQGLPLTFDELLPPMPPDEENFAMAPVIAPALDITYIDHPDPAKRDFVFNGEIKRQELNYLSIPFIHAERNGDWRLGKINDVAQMEQSYLEYLKEVGGGAVTEGGESESLEVAFARIESELDAIEKASQRPRAQFSVAYQRHIDALLPHLSILKPLPQLYGYRSEFALAKGDRGSAFRDLITGLRISGTLKNEPILISFVVRAAMVRESIHAIWEALRTNAFSDDQLRQLEAELSRINLLQHASNSLSGERLMYELFIDDFRISGPRILDLPDRLPTNLIPRGWFQRNKVVVSRVHDLRLRSLIDVAGQRYFPEKATSVDEHIRQEGTFWFDELLAEMAGNWKPKSGVLQKAALAQTYANLARVAVALERFQLTHGHYPESLNRLEPDYLEKLPHDLMTGEPLHYRRENGRFILYSVGLNQMDDGGAVVTQKFSDEPDLEKGDLVWSYFPLVDETDE